MNLHLVHLSSLARVLIFIAYEIDLQKIGPIEMKWNEIFIQFNDWITIEFYVALEWNFASFSFYVFAWL